MIAKSKFKLRLNLTWPLMVLLLISVVFCTSVFSQTTFCGEDEEQYEGDFESPLLKKAGALNAKVVFINFPVDAVPINTIANAKKANLDALCSYFTEASLPSKTMTWDLIEKPGDLTESIPWSAGKASISYRGLQDPNDPLFARSSHWWAESVSETGYWCSALLGEVLFNIKDAYVAAGKDNPFDDTDILIVNYLFSASENGHASPIYHPDNTWVGGVASIYLKPHSEYPDDVDPYFIGLGLGRHQTILGTQNVVHVDDLSCQTVLTHEFGHTLNLVHSQGFNSEDWEERYSYTLLDVMTGGYSEGKGCQTYSLHNISQLGESSKPNWYPVVDFTGENLYNQEVYDIRSDDAITYKFSLDDAGGRPQYFLFAYHGVNPVDVPQDSTTLPGVLQGLEVQHCFGGSNGSYRDLESAFGRFNDTPDSGFVESGYWTSPNTSDGFDNQDSWETRPMPEYEDYQGHVDDFFSFTGNQVFGFTPDCNPNTFGIDPNSTVPWRRRPNNQPNSLYVRIKSQTDDQMVVDFLSAPYEEITITSGEYHSATDDITFSYTITPEWEDYLTSFDVYFCPTQSGFPLYLVENVVYDPLVSEYSFPVLANYGTEAQGGQVIVKFNNNMSSHTGDFPDGPIYIPDLGPVVTESILLPNEGNHLVVGRDVRVEWSNSFSSGLVSTIDVIFDTGEAVLNLATLNEFDDDWFYDANLDHYFCTIPVTADMKTGSGAMYLKFNNITPQNIEDIDVSELVVLPPLVEYNDVSSTTFSAGEGYSAPPSAIVPISEDKSLLGVGKSMILSLAEGDDQTAGAFYKNTSTPVQIRLEEWTPSQHFSNGGIMAGASAIAAADYDGDGDEDFFVCNPGTGPSSLFKRDGSQFVKIEIGTTELTKGTNCATWIDFDHDGDLDLFLGRGGGGAGGPVLPNVLFEYNSMSDSFSVVSEANGLVNPGRLQSTQAVLWADLDLDGYWDVLIGNTVSSGGMKHFIQNSENQFVEAASQPFSGLDASSIICQDFNRDNQVDLVFGGMLGSTTIFFNSNGSFSSTDSYEISTSFTPFQISHGDFDNDGWLDLLLTSGGSDEGFCTFKNLMGQSGFDQKFVNISDDIDNGPGFGLPQLGAVKGAIQSDFDRDGDLDTFVGMPDGASGEAVWKNMNASSDWLGIRLFSTSGASPVGATVSLTGVGSAPLGSQLFGGSGGRGAQGTNDLIFGLDGSSVPVSVHVKWPSRMTTMETISDPSGLNKLIEVVEPPLWTIDSNSPNFEVVVLPDRIDWVFTWESSNWSPIEGDWVDYSPLQSCGNLTAASLLPGTTAGVSITSDYASDLITGAVTYSHTLTYEDAPCVPGCRISFTVHSGSSSIGYISSGPTTGRFPKLCPINIGN